MKHAIASATWLCILGLYAVSPASLPDEPHARRRAWELLGIAFALMGISSAIEVFL